MNNAALNLTVLVLTLMGMLFSYIYSYNLLLFVHADGFVWYAWEVSLAVSIISAILATAIGTSLRNNEIDQAVRKRLSRIG